MRRVIPGLTRFASKFTFDVMPAALASLVGGLLFAQVGRGLPPAPSVQPAGPQMMQMLAEEHALMLERLRQDVAAQERERVAADEASAAAKAAAAAADKIARLRRETREITVADAMVSGGNVKRPTEKAATPLPPQSETVAAAPVRQPLDLQIAAANSQTAATDTVRERVGLLARVSAKAGEVGGRARRLVLSAAELPAKVISLGDVVFGERSRSETRLARFM